MRTLAGPGNAAVLTVTDSRRGSSCDSAVTSSPWPLWRASGGVAGTDAVATDAVVTDAVSPARTSTPAARHPVARRRAERVTRPRRRSAGNGRPWASREDLATVGVDRLPRHGRREFRGQIDDGPGHILVAGDPTQGHPCVELVDDLLFGNAAPVGGHLDVDIDRR